MTFREIHEEREFSALSETAAKSAHTRGRKYDEPKCDLRTEFCRDRDRIIHSKAFRRLKSKTQVFLSPEGDHYRTRLTHTLEVSQIARTAARALRLNEDLTEAIALGHDLGHTPFGHAGERALRALNPDGFTHYEQSVRVLSVLEKYPKGLNVTYEVEDGIRCHTKGDWASTLEGQIVRHCDRIAYINHDIEDAVAAGILNETDLPTAATDVLGKNKSARITTLLTSLINRSGETLAFEDEVQRAYDELHDFMFGSVYVDKSAKKEEQKVAEFIERLYGYYSKTPERMPEMYLQILEKEGLDTAVTDYISGMSDAFAVSEFQNIFVPLRWSIKKADEGKT